MMYTQSNCSSNHMNDKIKIFAISVFLIVILGGSYLYVKNLNEIVDIPLGPALEATVEVSSPTIKVTKKIIEDTSNKNGVNTVILTAKVTNNTSKSLTGVKLVIPIDIGTLETPGLTRITNLPGQGADNVFGLSNLPPHTTTVSKVLLYAGEKRIYKFSTWIDTNERYTITTNTLILKAE